MSRDATALKHYLFHLEIKLVVPQVVIEEHEWNLINRAEEKVQSVLASLEWLSLLFGSINGCPQG